MSRKIFFLVLCLSAVVAAILYLFDPSKEALYPRCPFYVITGFKCPGCGTLRGLHALLHGRIIDAVHFNMMVLFVPILGIILFSRKLRYSPILGKITLGIVLLWWIIRNVFSLP